VNRIYIALGITFLASGCGMASVETTSLNTAPHPLLQRPAQAVEIYSSSPPVRAHVDIALLRAHQSNYEAGTPAMVQALAERAGQLGCDALFISGGTERAGAPGSAYLFDPGEHALFGTCIVYLTQPTAADANTPPPPSRAANAIVIVPPKASEPAPNAVVDGVTMGNSQR